MASRVEIGRVGNGPLVVLGAADGATVSDLLTQAELTLGSHEKVMNGDSEEVALTEDVEDGETYYIVASHKSG